MKFQFVVYGLGGAALSLLAACAPFGKQSPLDVPTAYSLPQGSSTKEVRDAWWTQLRDPKLNALIGQAVQTAPELRIAKARFEQAQAELGVSRSAGKTQIGVTAQGVGAYVNPKPDSGNFDTDHTLWLVHTALQGSWTFDFWGKNRARVASALGRRQAAAYEAAQARLEVAGAVAAQYFALQSLTEQHKLVGRRLEVAKETEKLLQQRVQAKILPPQEVYQPQLAQQQLRVQQLELERNISRIRHSLAVSAGKEPGALAGWQPSPQAEAPVLAVNRIRADLLGSRPDIAAQRALLQSRTQDIKAAKAEFYPNIELKLLAGMAHIDAFNVVNGKSQAMLGIVPAVHLPLFTSGALQSRLGMSHARYNEQVAVYDQTVLNAMRSAADAVADYQSLRSQAAVERKIVETADKAASAALQRKRAGLENGIAHLQKQDEALRAKMQAVRGRADLLTAWSNVHARLGGGFKAAAL